MSGPYILPQFTAKTDCQVRSLDQSSTAHQCWEEKQRAIYIQQVLLHASSFHLCVCVRRNEARTAAAVIVNWIKLKKDLFKSAKKINNRRREWVCSLREERSDSEVTD